MTKHELLKKAEDLHYDLIELENDSDEISDEQFDMMLELSDLMREFVREKHHKSYFEVPGVKDFYSSKVGVVEIDPDIAEAVQILNSKGYHTIASCSGHQNDTSWSKRNGISPGYIWMEHAPKETLLKGLRWDKHDKRNGKHVIRWSPKSPAGLKRSHNLILEYARKVKNLNLRPQKSHRLGAPAFQRHPRLSPNDSQPKDYV